MFLIPYILPALAAAIIAALFERRRRKKKAEDGRASYNQ